jgi:hypothetical protein
MAAVVTLDTPGRAAPASAAPQATPGDDGRGACNESSHAALGACPLEAKGDYWIAVAKCGNVRDGRAREACEAQAEDDRDSALADCRNLFRRKQNACRLLGQEPYDPVIDPANFRTSTKIDNKYFPLVPGTTRTYRTINPNNPTTETIIGKFVVTGDTMEILGVTCVVVRDTEFVNDEVSEDTLDYFAQDMDGNVWYFGEATKELENGEAVSFDGSWQTGVDGAKPGIIMKADPQPAQTYREEFALGDAEDMATVKSLTASATVPYGTFEGTALRTFEFSPLDPNLYEDKFYVQGVGQVLTIDLVTGDREELVSISTK